MRREAKDSKQDLLAAGAPTEMPGARERLFHDA
jgi:hypothetical protein